MQVLAKIQEIGGDVMMEKCALCGKEKELQLSHIIPKFIGRYLKQTSVGNIRNLENPDKVIQDIEKYYMLCHDCEELFSASERYFANSVFYPYHRDKLDTFDYNEQLFYFITSLSWRSLYLSIVDYVREGKLKLDVLEKMIESDRIMRDYLLGKRTDIGSIEHHIFFFDRIEAVKAPENSPYYAGNPHATVHRSLTTYSDYADNTIFTISNLMGIIVVTLYSKDSDEEWTGTQIYNSPNTLVAKNQRMRSRLGADIQFWMTQSKNASEKMSEATKKKIVKKLTDLGDDIKNYAIFQDFSDDQQINN